MTSSSLTHTQLFNDTIAPLRVGTQVNDNNIGYIKINWAARYVNLSIVTAGESLDQSRLYTNDAGLPLESIGLNLDDLRV
eukprot:1381831-Amorphochlora_amoeboformis.AAC.1